MLSTGTITFLFTDIEGSTPLWEQHPQQMAEALRIHNAALRQVIEANSGTVFKTVGDAFQAAFPTAPQALRAAIEGQREGEGVGGNGGLKSLTIL
jgi:class 3 adenylate cyclase